MMSKRETAQLLAFVSAFDQRTVGEVDVSAWHEIAARGRWTVAGARRVVVEHYEANADRPRITPAAITDRLRVIRSRAAESFEAPRIPDGLPNHEYPGWLRQLLAAHVDAEVEGWASTGEEPSRSLPAAPQQIGSITELAARAPEHVRAEIASGAQRLSRRSS